MILRRRCDFVRSSDGDLQLSKIVMHRCIRSDNRSILGKHRASTIVRSRSP
ncbi:hypothetical protein HanRHA438_Chr13g0577231 [Helianthus annuus]|nr:hypothetical protein HanIR_Chr13g0616061 [Helianthus annuus]KAJ0856324.1 hypothetical protein HanRHA438_Chr13g0577231 [Helianthus annuus]